MQLLFNLRACYYYIYINEPCCRATPDSYRPPSTNLINYAPRKSVKIAEKPSKGTEEDEVPVEGYAGDVAEDVEDSAPVPQENTFKILSLVRII